ncbi:MAG: ribonuclease III [Clostridia bacterium]|nr:ribonuclease III [Clostridia bacterium]MBR6779995.1 ribonuclease III [Clostridia bacterium]
MNIEKEIGYTFHNKALLRNALTHSSACNEKTAGQNNERLEFLGDSVLGFITAEYLWTSHSDLPEGQLTRRRAAAVCEKALAGYARQFHLGEYLYMGKGEEMTGGRNRASILADAFEALLAAIYLDGGMEKAKQFCLPFITTGDQQTEDFVDYKTELQEIVQKNPGEALTYVLVEESGPAHDRSFTVEVHLNSNCIGIGEGRSKKKAEQEAARKALLLMGIRES